MATRHYNKKGTLVNWPQRFGGNPNLNSFPKGKQSSIMLYMSEITAENGHTPKCCLGLLWYKYLKD